jgi:hypothetical protein
MPSGLNDIDLGALARVADLCREKGIDLLRVGSVEIRVRPASPALASAFASVAAPADDDDDDLFFHERAPVLAREV